MLYRKSSLVGLVDSFLLKKMDQQNYNVISVDSVKLITWNRLDLAFKKLYLELQRFNNPVAIRFYQEDIRAQTLGQYKEFGNENKSNMNIYQQVFDDLAISIDRDDFSEEVSIVPLACDGSILNGAHRTSVALHQNKSLMAVETCLKPIIVDYDYFLNRAVPAPIVESAVSKLLECGEDFYICFLWSSGKENWKESCDVFSQVAFKKDLNLSMNGAINLLYECYCHMDWIGDENGRYNGLRTKLTECFPSEFSCKVIIFQEKGGIHQVRKMKEKVRAINNIGFSSVHITDTKDEVVRLSSFILNSNAFHFLNYSYPASFRHAGEKMLAVKNQLIEINVSANDVVVDGSFVMEMYGIKKANDIDYLLSESVSQSAIERLGWREEQLRFHGVGRNDLIYNFKYYFYYHGVKVISLKQLFAMKKRRNEAKDLLDCKAIEGLLGGKGKLNNLTLSLSRFIIYQRIKTKRNYFEARNSLLKFLGLYSILKSIKNRLSKRQCSAK